MMTIIRACFALCLAMLALTTQVAAQGSYRIQPGDVLRVEVLEDESLNRELLVLPDGRISMPLAGDIKAAGRTVSQVKRAITSGLSNNFSLKPTVYVGVNKVTEPEERPEPEARMLSVYVLGEATKTGLFEVEPGTTVLQVFSRMGGFTNFAAKKRIQLRRRTKEGERIYTLNYKHIERGKSSAGLAPVMEGDVIVIPQRRLFE
ncbi:polysaccharide biosynthesis/export family protein [Pacificoceanicola onchidii]|uniref:polysaccharide biosynthesis/export family protein n=1 Tax=Pacificoceanicola onchidii TaxID=2562685 RepID=UPI001F0E6B69|nr:polysaccharide biosynthesis/export family protein [Pacificoceanicola onchidii]